MGGDAWRSPARTRAGGCAGPGSLPSQILLRLAVRAERIGVDARTEGAGKGGGASSSPRGSSLFFGGGTRNDAASSSLARVESESESGNVGRGKVAWRWPGEVGELVRAKRWVRMATTRRLEKKLGTRCGGSLGNKTHAGP